MSVRGNLEWAMNVSDAMDAAERAELVSYRRLIEQCRQRAYQEEAQLRNMRLSPEELRVRVAMVWAKFTLSTADVELAALAIERRLVEAESLKSIRVAAL